MKRILLLFGTTNKLINANFQIFADICYDVKLVKWPEIKYIGMSYSEPLSEQRLVEYIDELIVESNSVPIIICSHSEIVLTRIRRRIKEGVIKCDECKIIWSEEYLNWQQIDINADGRLSCWPLKLFSASLNDLAELL